MPNTAHQAAGLHRRTPGPIKINKEEVPTAALPQPPYEQLSPTVDFSASGCRPGSDDHASRTSRLAATLACRRIAA
jgi:hypothetical protein